MYIYLIRLWLLRFSCLSDVDMYQWKNPHVFRGFPEKSSITRLSYRPGCIMSYCQCMQIYTDSRNVVSDQETIYQFVDVDVSLVGDYDFRCFSLLRKSLLSFSVWFAILVTIENSAFAKANRFIRISCERVLLFLVATHSKKKTKQTQTNQRFIVAEQKDLLHIRRINFDFPIARCAVIFIPSPPFSVYDSHMIFGWCVSVPLISWL